MRKPPDLHVNSSKCFTALREIGAEIKREVQQMIAKRYTLHNIIQITKSLKTPLSGI